MLIAGQCENTVRSLIPSTLVLCWPSYFTPYAHSRTMVRRWIWMAWCRLLWSPIPSVMPTWRMRRAHPTCASQRVGRNERLMRCAMWQFNCYLKQSYVFFGKHINLTGSPWLSFYPIPWRPSSPPASFSCFAGRRGWMSLTRWTYDISFWGVAALGCNAAHQSAVTGAWLQGLRPWYVYSFLQQILLK